MGRVKRLTKRFGGQERALYIRAAAANLEYSLPHGQSFLKTFFTTSQTAVFLWKDHDALSMAESHSTLNPLFPTTQLNF